MKTAMHKATAGMALLLAAASLPAQQSETRGTDTIDYPPVYRVEVIVFRHADGRSDRSRASAPVDFNGHLDPLLLATAHELAERRLAELARLGPPVAIVGEADQTTPFLRTEDETIRPIPPLYAALGRLSPSAGRAMSRLSDAPQYEPLATRAWIQLARPRQDTARVRLHDRTVVDRIDATTDGATTDGTATPALEVYRLDGTIRLSQRQFLHLDLDLVWQTRAGALTDRRTPSGGPEATEGEWQLHRLQQSRIVRPGRLEYFDSSLFGVLVRIDRFEQVVPEIEIPEPEPEPEPEPAAPATDSPESSQMVDPVTNSGG